MRVMPLVCKVWAESFRRGSCGPSRLSLRRNLRTVLPAGGGFHQQQQQQQQSSSATAATDQAPSPPPPLARVVQSLAPRFSASVRSVRLETGFLSSTNPPVGSAAARAEFGAAARSDDNAAVEAAAAAARAFFEGDVAPVRALLDCAEPRGARLRGVRELQVLFHRPVPAQLLSLLFYDGNGNGEGGGGGGGLARAPALESLTLVRPRMHPTDSPATVSKGKEGRRKKEEEEK